MSFPLIPLKFKDLRTRCAIMAGDVDMLKILVEHRADPNGRIRGLAELGYYDEQTPLMVAVKSYQDSEWVMWGCVLN